MEGLFYIAAKVNLKNATTSLLPLPVLYFKDHSDKLCVFDCVFKISGRLCIEYFQSTSVAYGVFLFLCSFQTNM